MWLTERSLVKRNHHWVVFIKRQTMFCPPPYLMPTNMLHCLMDMLQCITAIIKVHMKYPPQKQHNVKWTGSTRRSQGMYFLKIHFNCWLSIWISSLFPSLHLQSKPSTISTGPVRIDNTSGGPAKPLVLTGRQKPGRWILYFAVNEYWNRTNHLR